MNSAINVADIKPGDTLHVVEYQGSWDVRITVTTETVERVTKTRLVTDKHRWIIQRPRWDGDRPRLTHRYEGQPTWLSGPSFRLVGEEEAAEQAERQAEDDRRRQVESNVSKAIDAFRASGKSRKAGLALQAALTEFLETHPEA